MQEGGWMWTSEEWRIFFSWSIRAQDETLVFFPSQRLFSFSEPY